MGQLLRYMTIKTQFGIHTGSDLIPHDHVNYILNELEFNMILQCQLLLGSLVSYPIDKVVNALHYCNESSVRLLK